MVQTIDDLLKAEGLEQYCALFQHNEVDLDTLRVLTAEDLAELGLPFGPRKKLLAALHKASTAPPPSSSGNDGERRQLTVMFCDMVGFTELAHRLDAEHLKDVVQRYEDIGKSCIERFGGFLFTMLGDGLVAFFGFPVAHEGEAERAIHAGLAILKTLAETEFAGVGHLEARIGIATGIVVVASGERNAVGETMNLAARLQSFAEPGTLLVTRRVMRHAGGGFAYEALGENRLKGIPAPVALYRVTGVSEAESRFDAVTEHRSAELVGREQEVAALTRSWNEVRRTGAGEVIEIAGEAGLGKSLIVSGFRQRAFAQGAAIILIQCQPFFAGSAFFPWISTLERLADLHRADTPDARLERLHAFLVHRLGLPDEDVRFVAAIMVLPYEGRYDRLTLSPDTVRNETRRVLVDAMLAFARSGPTVVIFEDAHWADPASRDTLQALVARVPECAVLVLATYRPEFQPTWGKAAHIHSLTLSRLTGDETRGLILVTASGRTLPREVANEIAVKSDGVPLFVEELTRSVLESGGLVLQGDQYVLAENVTRIPVPGTLRDALTARLDRVSEVKQVARLGSVIGREFSRELITALNLVSAEQLQTSLSQLIASGLASISGEAATETYVFKHALVQDVVYDSMLKGERRLIHERVARALEDKWPETCETRPEILAHHHTEAGAIDRAVPLWRRAGALAIQRFAPSEAATHLRRGLKLIESIAPSSDRDQLELSLRTMLGPAIVAHRGWANGEVSDVLEPAWKLAERLDYREGYVPIINALWVHYMCADKLARSLEWANRLIAIGAGEDDTFDVVGHRAASGSHFWLGEFAQARSHGDLVRARYDPQRHWNIVHLTNTDPLTGEGIYRSQFLWILGFPDQAVAAARANDAHARERNHPFDLAFGLTLGAQVFDFLHAPEELLSRTEEAERIGREHGVPLLSEAMAEICRGIALLRSNHFAQACAQLDFAVARLAETGHCIWIAYLRALQAEALARSGNLQGAQTLIERAAAQAQAGEDRSRYAEILRLKGWILAECGEVPAAEASLRGALAVARAQGALSWELRAATSLARLLDQTGKRAEACALLAPIYARFEEGFGTRDLMAARDLIAQLQSTA
jgi:class 3 adenylate cyclase/tetratricopeptide (TPR) repeat protein